MRSHLRGRFSAVTGFVAVVLSAVIVLVIGIAVSAAARGHTEDRSTPGAPTAVSAAKSGAAVCAGVGLFLNHYDAADSAIAERRWDDSSPVPEVLDAAASIITVVEDLARTAREIGLHRLAESVDALGGRYGEMVFASGRFQVEAAEILIDQETSALRADIEAIRLGHRILGCRVAHPRRTGRP